MHDDSISMEVGFDKLMIYIASPCETRDARVPFLWVQGMGRESTGLCSFVQTPSEKL